MGRRECDLELGLRPSSASIPSFNFSPISMMTMPFPANGGISIFDLTELQARAIIWVASQGRNGNNRSTWPNPEWITLQFLMNGNTGFSMKKSLQKFLQRRKRRIQSLSPYHKF